MAKVGRPVSFDETKAAAILACVENGVYVHAAAESVGVSRRAVYRWLSRGKRSGEADRQFREFRHAYMQAQAKFRVKVEKSVASAAEKGFDEAIKWLERRFPRDWSSDKKRLRDMEKTIEAMEKERARDGAQPG